MTEEQVLLVLGAAGGMGTAIVRELASRGHRVVAAGRSEATLRAATEPLREQGALVADLPVDLASLRDGEGLVDFALDTFGRLDCLINAAAVYLESPADQLTAESWASTMEPNLRGPVLVSSSVARHLCEQRRGRIVHITSITGSVSRGRYTLYESSKAGLEAAVRSMAVELGPYCVLVNGVAPGWVRTPMSQGLLEHIAPGAVAELIPLGRVGEPDEIAEVACWLALDSPAFLTGQIIAVDGGQTARTGHL
jgi:NAD(P)-dependent dehydrogenase (short-subunit alcohol dehydrogenase family)